MQKTLARRLLAVAMMACMLLAMALPASAAYRYELELKITEALYSVKTSTSKPSKITVKASSGSVSESADLTAELVNLLVANFEGEAKNNKSGLWDFESDAMGKTIADGLKAYRTEDYGTAWDAWIDGFANKDEITGDRDDLVTLLKGKKTVDDMEVNTPYVLTYEPSDSDVVRDDDPAKDNTYTFTLTLNRRTFGGGGGGGYTPPSEPTPVDPTPGTVAVLIKDDGTEMIIRDSVVTQNGVKTSLPHDDNKIKITDNTKTFNDVTDAHWGKDAVTFVAARYIFAGTGNNNFSPDVTTTRGMIAQVLHNLEYNEEHPYDGHQFPDVLEHHWYNNAVHWAEDTSVVAGYGDGTFKGDKTVTREELVVMLWNYAGKQASQSNDHVNGFNDAEKVSDWALNAMNWGLELGVLAGKGNKMLDPTGPATRAELAQMIKNYCENK